MPPVIRLDKLTKRFGAETALDRGFAGGAARRGVRPAGRKRGGQDHRHPHHARAGRAQLRPGRSARASTAPRKGCKSASGWATCPNGPRCTSG